MNPRFDLFQKQNNHFIKWVATAESLEEIEKLMQLDSAGTSQDNYLIVQSDYGVTKAHVPASVTKLVSERELRISPLDCT